MSALTDAERLQLEAWCHAYVDGVLGAADHAALEALVLGNAEARALYVRCVALSAHLQDAAGGSLAVRTRGPQRRSWHWGAAAAVAVGLAAAGAALWPRAESPVAVAVEEEGIAMLAASENSVWAEEPVAVGASLAAGRMLHLLGGTAEVAFDCGARLLLQGPTTMEISTAWTATLTQGTLHANVPPEAVGFRVINPAVDVVDLGTEFSVVTDAAGASEVFVHRGAVEVHPKTTPRPTKSVMREKEARRFTAAASGEVGDVDRKWLALARPASLPVCFQPTLQHRWAWQADHFPGLLPTHPDKLKFTPAPCGPALLCDGHYAAQIVLPNAMQEEARTIGLWVRIPADAPLAEAPPFLSWRGQGRAALLEAGTNDDPAHGPVGALELRLGNRQLLGTKSLRDGAWHHLAIVLLKVTKPQGAADWQARWFIDGRQDARAGKGKGRKPSPKAAPGLWLGTGVDDAAGEYFIGEIGGLTLADGVLSQAEIRQLGKGLGGMVE